MNKDNYNLEQQKEIEFEYEKEKLNNVLSLINNEIIDVSGKRKDISENIKKYREKALEEFRDDEDKIVEYFDHEKFVKEETFKSIYRRLHELFILYETPYFGRIQFIDEEFNEEINLYIGRFGLIPEGDCEPVIIDWRAPVASLFYNSKLGKSSYKAPEGEIDVDLLLKRQYIIKNQDLVGMFDSEMDIKDDILQMVLSENSGEKLKDIIMTIQSEQDNLIRQPKYNTIVVNGTAGSGKTTIALHRVAYLLYNNRETLQGKVLILGPNDIFMEYISNVLPSLGEIGVKQQTFNRFAMDILQLDEVMNIRDYMEKILSGNNEFIEEILYKNSPQFVDELDELIYNLESDYYNIDDVKFNGNVIVSKDEIEQMFNYHFKSMPLFKRSDKIKRIIFSRIKDKRDQEVRIINKEYKDKISKMTKEELEIEGNNLELIRSIKIREVIKEVIEVKKTLNWLSHEDITHIYSKFNKNKQLTVDDLAPLLYLKHKLEGYKTKQQIKHIVIDEAQDYSLLQFIVIREITRCNAFTIVGDVNQRMIPLKGTVPMLKVEEIFKDINVEKFTLNKSYRSTKEIMNYANKYISDELITLVVRNGYPVEEHNIDDYDILLQKLKNDILEFKNSEYESLAIICKDLYQTKIISKLLKKEEYIKIMDSEDKVFGCGVILMPVYFAKGLEFDSVIMINDVDYNVKGIDENKLKYIMATRALHKLCVYNLVVK